MLTWLLQELTVVDAGFAVFQYITLRGILSAITALLILTSLTIMGHLLAQQRRRSVRF